MKSSKPNVAEMADKIRRTLGYSQTGPISFADLCDRNRNLTIVERPFSENTSGMCVKDGSESGIIAINSTMALGRQRFTLAHELYHFYYSNNPFIVCPSDEDNAKTEDERNANIFATHFLMPTQSFIAYFEDVCEASLSIDTILKMEHYFQVSRRALLSKFCSLGYLSQEDKDKFLVNIVRTASEKGYPKDLYVSPNKPQQITYGKYVALVGEMFERGLISKQKRDELLLDAYRDDIVFPPQEGE